MNIPNENEFYKLIAKALNKELSLKGLHLYPENTDLGTYKNYPELVNIIEGLKKSMTTLVADKERKKIIGF